jgi:hypothetical protein
MGIPQQLKDATIPQADLERGSFNEPETIF